jgi:hypothetical protein
MGYSQVVMSKSPLAYLRLGEVSGTTAADETTAHPGTYVNAPTLGVSGMVAAGNTAAAFARASSQRVEWTTLGTIGANILTSSWMFWIKTSDITNTGCILGAFDTGTSQACQILTNRSSSDTFLASSTMFYIRGTDAKQLRGAITANIYDGLPHCVIAVPTSATTFAIYVDGASVAVSYNGNTTPVTFAAFGFAMGVSMRNLRGVYDNPLSATLDEVAVFPSRLSAADAAEIYAAGSAYDPLSPGLSASTQDKSVAIRVQTLDGMWETLGVDRLRGVWPENDSYTADEWGPSKCSFDLKRDPGTTFPDLSAWTPCEVEVGGVVVWDGRIQETPTREAERVVNVQGNGWQSHLDDDQYQRTYVHRKLADWRDSRSFVGENLVAGAMESFTSAGQVTSDRGVIALGWQNGAILPANASVGVKLDMGAGQAVTSLAVEVHGITGSANSAAKLYVVASASEVAFGSGANYAFTPPTLVTLGTTTSVYQGNFPTPARYVTVCLNVPAGITLNGDVTVRLAVLVTTTDTTYSVAASTDSTLKATDIIPDALNRATLLLSSDRSGIDPNGTVTFVFPEFGASEQRTPREVIDAADSVHGYRKKVAVGRRMIFEPKPSVPSVEIGEWPGSEFDDASANSGDEIYNAVVVEGTGPDGAPLSIGRSAAQQSGIPLQAITSPAATNPSFATNTTGWSALASTVTRDTGVFDSSPASGRWDTGGAALAAGARIKATFTGTFKAGVPYQLSWRWRWTGAVAVAVHAYFGPVATSGWDTTSDREEVAWSATNIGWSTQVLSWLPQADSTTVVLIIVDEAPSSRTGLFYVDSLALNGALPTIVDRRGFVRKQTLPVKCSLTTALGQQIGDTFLAAHKTTPLKGSVKITGDGAARDIRTGASVPPAHLLLMTGDLLRLSDRVDPDAGGHGRDGRIAEVTWTPATDSATVALDSRRTNHEALLSRLSVVVGGG